MRRWRRTGGGAAALRHHADLAARAGPQLAALLLPGKEPAVLPRQRASAVVARPLLPIRWLTQPRRRNLLPSRVRAIEFLALHPRLLHLDLHLKVVALALLRVDPLALLGVAAAIHGRPMLCPNKLSFRCC